MAFFSSTKTSKVGPGILKVSIRSLIYLLLFLASVALLVLYKLVYFNHADFTSFFTWYAILTSFYLITRVPTAHLYSDEHKSDTSLLRYPTVSVIVAVKNEEQVIYETIRSAVSGDFPADLECVVVNDGSTDGTEAEIKRAIRDFGRQVKLVSFPENRGKRDAMAAGVKKARYKIIVFLDSDSRLKTDSLRHVTEHFLTDDSVGAVSGNTKVHNESENTLTKMQAVQYAISFDIYKAGESIFGAVTCCPGCFSAYRRNAILPLLQKWRGQKFLGAKGTFGDDRGLTNFVLKNSKVIYCRAAEATTVVPSRFSIYLRQQLRWKKSWFREGLLAAAFMWRRHPLASAGFYIHFTFPFMAPVLGGYALWRSFVDLDPLLFPAFTLGFAVLSLLFGFYLHLFEGRGRFGYVTLFSLMFAVLLIWQMPYAMLTVTRTHWGTR